MSLIITVRNLSELAPVSDYEYTVLIGDGGPRSKVISGGIVTGHLREDGWIALAQKVLDHAQRGYSRPHKWRPRKAIGHPHADRHAMIQQCERCCVIKGEPGSDDCPL